MSAAANAICAIDYGTSNSLVAMATPEGVLPPLQLDANALDTSVLKSITFTPNAESWFFGSDAIREYGLHGAQGRMFKSLKRYLPDPSFSGTHVNGRLYSLVDLIARFLRELRDRAALQLGYEPTRVLLGRPALFHADPEKDSLAERRLEAAARQAGFTEVHFLPEPVAAANDVLARLTSPKLVLVADFGGGTSDFTVVRLDPKGFRREDVLAVTGVPMAGDAFDGAIMRKILAPHFGSEVVYKLPLGSNDLRLPNHLINRLSSPADINFLGRADVLRLLKDAQRWSLAPKDGERMQRLFTLIEEQLGYAVFREVERVKIALSDADSALFDFPGEGIALSETVQNADFRLATDDLVAKIITALDEALLKSGLAAHQIDLVFATGGTAHLPALRAELIKRFGSDKLDEGRFFHSIVSGLAQFGRQLI